MTTSLVANSIETQVLSSSGRGLTIVVPCFNEEEGIPQLYQKLMPAIERLSVAHTVNLILVDDGSTDRTLEVIRETFGLDGPFLQVVRHGENRGVAAAISTGISAAKTEIVCSIDADCTYDPDQIAKLISMLSEGVDVVVASPYHPGGSVQNISAWRLALSRTACRIYSWFFRNKLHTYTACFRAYRRSVVNQFHPTKPGFVGVVELLWMLDRAGSKFAECPARLTARCVGQSKMRIVSVALAHFRLIMKIAMGTHPDGGVTAPATSQSGNNRAA